MFQFHSFLIKYGEIAIKGKNRYLFEDKLVEMLGFALKPVEGEFEITKEQMCRTNRRMEPRETAESDGACQIRPAGRVPHAKLRRYS